MAKKAIQAKKAVRRAASSPANAREADVPAVSGREPCPCGSGRRYKACHGRESTAAATRSSDPRPFRDLPGECDWVAMREIVPAATASVTLRGGYAGRTATVATVLPMAWPALARQDGQVFIGLQVPAGSGDPSAHAADALIQALESGPGTPVTTTSGRSVRLQDLLDSEATFDVEVHQGFDFWLHGVDDQPPDVAASMERANEAVVPTARLTSVEAAYWCQIRERNHLRWVLPHDEDELLDALARLHVLRADVLIDGSRYVGSFRADGLLVPVWDLPPGTPAEALEEPAVAFAGRLGEALADDRPLDQEARRARAGLRNRQVTLR